MFSNLLSVVFGLGRQRLHQCMFMNYLHFLITLFTLCLFFLMEAIVHGLVQSPGFSPRG